MSTQADWDIIVIGAGIHGAGIVQAAAAAGHRCMLLEQYDRPAVATSSRSSKLIHGGLRYLESAQFALVHECLRERELLLRNAPQLVELKRFNIPVYRNTRRRPWQIWLGLMLYAVLSRRGFHRLARRQWSDLDGLTIEGLDAVFSYYDAQTDDARLTRAVIASAQSLSAEVRYSTEVLSADYVHDMLRLQCRDTSGDIELSARLVINATGPWVGGLHDRLVAAQATPSRSPRAAPPVSLVQGSHIVLPQAVSQPYYLEAPQDGRAVFVLPWQGHTLVGTTEKVFTGPPEQVEPAESEIHYLLDIYRHYFPAQAAATDEGAILESFAGLRVLPGGESAAFGKSRDTIMLADVIEDPRVISVFGGKLTAYRATAEKLLRDVSRFLPAATAVADTCSLRLPEVD